MALVERFQKVTDVTFWKGEIPTSYIYTVGRAGERFFREIKDNGKLIGAKCDKCGKVYVPPRTYCESCFARLEENYVDVSSKGTVHTFTVCHYALDGTSHEKPSVLAVIELEGAVGRLVHRIGEIDPDKVSIGMEVEAVFKPKEKRVGSILDIEYFKPV